MAANNSKRTIHRVAVACIFIIYLMGLFYFLFVSEKFGRSESQGYRYNLTLLKEIKRFMNYANNGLGWKAFLVNVVGNVVAFVPFGFLIPILQTKKYNRFLVIILTTLLGAIFSTLVEVIQFCFKIGSFDVDDILLNVIGAFIGVLIYAVVSLFTGTKK